VFSIRLIPHQYLNYRDFVVVVDDDDDDDAARRNWYSYITLETQHDIEASLPSARWWSATQLKLPQHGPPLLLPPGQSGIVHDAESIKAVRSASHR
jgi:hypothetical protein